MSFPIDQSIRVLTDGIHCLHLILKRLACVEGRIGVCSIGMWCARVAAADTKRRKRNTVALGLDLYKGALGPANERCDALTDALCGTTIDAPQYIADLASEGSFQRLPPWRSENQEQFRKLEKLPVTVSPRDADSYLKASAQRGWSIWHETLDSVLIIVRVPFKYNTNANISAAATRSFKWSRIVPRAGHWWNDWSMTQRVKWLWIWSYRVSGGGSLGLLIPAEKYLLWTNKRFKNIANTQIYVHYMLGLYFLNSSTISMQKLHPLKLS